MNSIRQRIIVFVFLSLFITNVISGYYIYQHTQHEIDEIFDAEQAQLARTIDRLLTNAAFDDSLHAIVSSVPDIKNNTNAQSHEYEQKIAYQIWDLEGNLLLMSENAPLYPLGIKKSGFSQIILEGQAWHIFCLYSASAQKWIYTAQKLEARNELITLITQVQLKTMLVVNVIILILIILGTVIGMRPIALLSRELAFRNGTNLKSIDIKLAHELQPIQLSINRLLERVQETLVQEKSFNADLSHELRTPLAAIKVHAQTIELTENLTPAGIKALQNIICGIDIMTQTIEQLLLLGNIEFQSHDHMQTSIDLQTLIQDILILLPADTHKKLHIELSSESLKVRGNKTLLTAMLRNLIDNAVKYSQKNAHICIKISTATSFASVEVIDNGPGMTDEQKVNAIQRRYRVSDTQTYGSGLGLSIVKKIIDLHQGQLEFKDREDMQGLIAQVKLPKL